MVVAKNKTLENIWTCLENIQEYVVSDKISKADRKVLAMIECDLLGLEGKLRLFTNYKPARRDK
jgi:hypothetical protein